VRLQALRDAEQWIARQTRFWEQRADALAARFEDQGRRS
jgi:hypothetical protein